MDSGQTDPAQQTDPPQSPAPPRRGIDPRLPLALVAILVIAGGIALLTQGAGTGSQRLPGNVSSVVSSDFRGSVASPPKPAPGLVLHNDLGRTIDIAAYRGKAVLVTFLYTHCPDVCPLIATNLGAALRLMGPKQAAKTQVIAVSVDPRGDTAKAVTAFLRRHHVTGRMQYLIGSAHELARVWSAWNVGSEQDVQQPQLVNHSGLVYGISAGGKLTTLYAANFRPSDIAHDAPLLSSQ